MHFRPLRTGEMFRRKPDDAQAQRAAFGDRRGKDTAGRRAKMAKDNGAAPGQQAQKRTVHIRLDPNRPIFERQGARGIAKAQPGAADMHAQAQKLRLVDQGLERFGHRVPDLFFSIGATRATSCKRGFPRTRHSAEGCARTGGFPQPCR